MATFLVNQGKSLMSHDTGFSVTIIGVSVNMVVRVDTDEDSYTRAGTVVKIDVDLGLNVDLNVTFDGGFTVDFDGGFDDGFGETSET